MSSELAEAGETTPRLAVFTCAWPQKKPAKQSILFLFFEIGCLCYIRNN